MIFMNSKPPSWTLTMVSAFAEASAFSECLSAVLRVPSATNFRLPATRISVISESIGANFFILSKNLSATIVGTMLKPVVRESAVPSIVCTKIVWLFRPAANLTL